MSKFTPGPYRIEAYEENGSQIYFVKAGIKDVALTSGPCGLANARLIAAAPEMFEALKAAKEFLVSDLEEPGRTVFWKVVSALDKAEGKTNE